jgi:hypothetical protein
LPVKREREKDAFRERGGEPVRQAEMRVGFGERARDPLEPRGEHHRPRDEAAGAEHCVRLAAVEDGAAGDRCRKRLAQRAHLLQADPAR